MQGFDVVVVGAAHAGCEAALAARWMGCRTLLLTMNLDAIGPMSCKLPVGDTAKEHLLRKVDAVGGVPSMTPAALSLLGAWCRRAQTTAVE